MIQFILILLGLVPSNDNAKTSVGNQQNSYTATAYSVILPSYEDGGPVGGETEQTPPPRK